MIVERHGNEWRERENDSERGGREGRETEQLMYFYKLKTAFACQRSPEELMMYPVAAHCTHTHTHTHFNEEK